MSNSGSRLQWLALAAAVILTPGLLRFAEGYSRRHHILAGQGVRSLLRDTSEALVDRQRSPLGGQPATLVRQSSANAEIVLSRGADPVDENAAALLQEWLERASGVRLAIRRQRTGLVPIYVGKAAIEAGLVLDDIESRSGEGLRVRVEPDRVLLAGRSDSAGLKAAAVFLEELGCRWYMEGELGKHCPKSTTLRIDPVQITDRPGFVYRRIWGANGWSRETPWKTWNGAGGLDLEMGHAWDQIIHPDDYDDHPDWFAMNESGHRVRSAWLNTGNPDLRRVFAERLSNSIEPGQHPSLSPPDGFWPDYSPESRRYDDPNSLDPSSRRVSMSNRFMAFANDVAASVAKTHPETILSFYAYSDYSQPPTLIDRLEPNLCIWIAPIRFSRFHRLGSPNSPSRRQLVEVIEGWSDVASLLGYRTYNYNLAESMTPFSKLTTWTHDIPYLASRGFIGISLETFPTWDLSAPTIYLSLRLAYSPGASPKAVLDDFYRGFYGPARESMRRYWEAVDDGWQGLQTESGSIYSVHLVFTPERMRQMDRSLTEAEHVVAGDSVLETRVAMARIGYLHARDFISVRDALQTADVGRALEVYRTWEARTEASIEAGTGHSYNLIYLRRFIGRAVEAVAAALDPSRGDRLRVTSVLPDVMTLTYEDDLMAGGAAGANVPPRAGARQRRRVRTFGATLDQQGFADRFGLMWYQSEFRPLEPRPGPVYLHFNAIDGISSVWVNGQPVTETTGTGEIATFPALAPFTVEVTELVGRGGNRVAIKVDHRTVRELSLGGIVAPIYVLEP